METVSDAFLLQLAGIATSLLGFFVIGVFFYVQRGMFPQAAEQANRYLRAATGTIILLYGMTVILAMSLVALEPERVALVYSVLSLLLVWSVIRTSQSVRRLHEVLQIRIMSQLALWSAAAVIVSAPWLMGGSSPTRSHLAWSVAIVGIFAFASSASLVLSTLDIATLEASASKDISSEPDDPGRRPEGGLVEAGPSEGAGSDRTSA